MIAVKDIRVFTLEQDAVTVTWQVVDTAEDLSLYALQVLRSEAMVGPYHQVSRDLDPALVDGFRDSTVDRLTLRRAHIYQVRVKRLSDGVTETFGSRDFRLVLKGEDPLGVPLESVPDLQAAESIRRFDLVARELAGRKALILRRRTTGQFCPECWEAETRRSLRSDCEACWGTGRTGGYYTPQQTWIVESPPKDDQAQLTSLFELEQNDRVVRVSGLTRVSPRDVIIQATGERYSVQAVRTNHRGGAATWLYIQMRQLAVKDVEHKIPVHWDADSVTSGPVRQYIRATDIESFRKARADRNLGGEAMGSQEFPTTPASEAE